jgi:hypothetical protein
MDMEIIKKNLKIFDFIIHKVTNREKGKAVPVTGRDGP